MCNIGVRPTVGANNGLTIETNIFDFDEDIYGLDIRIAFRRRIRAEQRFASLEELKALRDKVKNTVVMRGDNTDNVRVVVGMATCGIAAGARPVLNAVVEAVNGNGLSDKVSVSQTGCIGLCRLEPIVEVYVPGEEKVTYVKMDAKKALEVVEQHLIRGQVVTEYTIGNTLK